MCHVFPYTIKTAVTQRNENGRNVKVLEKSQRFKMFLFRQSTYWFPLTCSLNVRKGPMKRTLQNPLKHLEQIQSSTILTWHTILPTSSAEEGFENTTQWIFNQLPQAADRNKQLNICHDSKFDPWSFQNRHGGNVSLPLSIRQYSFGKIYLPDPGVMFMKHWTMLLLFRWLQAGVDHMKEISTNLFRF